MSVLIVQREEKDLTKFALAMQQLAAGRSNAVGECTLTESATSTVVTAVNCGPESVVLLSPLTANAAAAVATTYVSAVAAGSFTLTHANNSQTDKTFGFVCIG